MREWVLEALVIISIAGIFIILLTLTGCEMFHAKATDKGEATFECGCRCTDEFNHDCKINIDRDESISDAEGRAGVGP